MLTWYFTGGRNRHGLIVKCSAQSCATVMLLRTIAFRSELFGGYAAIAQLSANSPARSGIDFFMGASCRDSPAEDVNRDCCLLDTLQPAAVFLDGVARALDLACTGLATQLRNQLVELADAGCAERMTLGLQAA